MTTTTTRASLLPSPKTLRGVVGVAVLFVAAEIFTRAGLVSSDYLPPASSIMKTVAELLVDPEFLSAVLATGAAWLTGLALAILIAVPLGLILGASNFAYRVSITIIEFLRPIPSVALIPLAILLFGRGLQMKAALVLFASVWPILFNTIYGMHNVEPVSIDTGRAFGLGRRKILSRIALPSASPFIFTGIKISAAIALILAISAELLAGGANGIGTWMLDASASGAQQLVYATTVVTGILGWLINVSLTALERRLFAWNVIATEAGS